MTSLMQEIVVDSREIEQIRSLVLEQVTTNRSSYDEVDIVKVTHDDWMVKKFIHHKNHHVNDSVSAIIKHLKWRKSMAVSSLKSTDFPSEFYSTSELHQYSRDRNNTATIYCRVKYHKPMSEFNPMIKKFLVYMMEKSEDEIRNGSNGFALIYDCYGGSIFNNNMDLLSFLITTYFDNYPCSLKYIALIDLPWMLCAIYNICKNLLPEVYRKLFVLLDRKSAHDYIGSPYLPDYLNGQCNLSYRVTPTSCLSIDKMHLNDTIKSSSLIKFQNHYSKIIQSLDDENVKEISFQDDYSTAR